MKHRKKLKPWAKVLVIILSALGIAILAFPFALSGYYLLAEAASEKDFCLLCLHKLKPVVAAELVSQEKPLVFFELLEQPKIEGIKVKLTYADGSSEIVRAYEQKRHTLPEAYTHEKGMRLDLWYNWDSLSRPERPLLAPGLNKIAMYCTDFFDVYAGEETEDVFCMVEVYAQTPEEYLAEHSPLLVTVTETEDGTLSLSTFEDGLLRLLAEESGTYTFQAEGDFIIHEWLCAGSGSISVLDYQLDDNHYSIPTLDVFAPRSFYSIYDYSAQLVANEPLYLRVHGPYIGRINDVRISKLTRAPEDITS